MVAEFTDISDEVLKETYRQLSEATTWKLKQGVIGENLVFEYLNSHRKVEKTENWFDSEKDGTVDGKTYEVKCIFPWYAKDAFPLCPTQVKKVMEADEVYIVQVPAANEDHINIWRLNENARPRYTTVAGAQRTTALWSISDTTLVARFRIHEVAKYLRRGHPSARTFKAFKHYGAI